MKRLLRATLPTLLLGALISVITTALHRQVNSSPDSTSGPAPRPPLISAAPAGSAAAALAHLPSKGRATKTGYSRDEFGTAWTDANTSPWGGNGLRTREDVLSRDLSDTTCKVPPPTTAAPHCTVQTGSLHDPYTGATMHFTRGPVSSMAVQIDHVVALGDAWQTGAQQLTAAERTNLANDPLELVAVDQKTNGSKGDSDAASWLPPNKAYRCAYVSRQIAVKAKYALWVTPTEKAAIGRVLAGCSGQPLPTAADAERRTY